MLKPWRLLVIAAALTVTLGAGVAAAQTVIVRNAPPGTPVELVFEATPAVTGTANGDGVATLAFNLTALSKTEIDASVFVDTCDKTHRIVIAEHLATPPSPAAGCERREVQGVYWVRPVNTIVVDVGGFVPKVLLVKGSYTPPKPTAEGADTTSDEAKPKRPSPTGLVVSGGLGIAQFRDARNLACGNVTPCGGGNPSFGYTGGVAFWFTKWLAAEATYIKPGKTTASGSGDTFNFDDSLSADVFTIGGKLAAPIGPFRLYGQAGTNYHQAISRTTNTVAGAAQSFELRTNGWSWVFGGGAEGWIKPKFAIFGEVNLARIRGVDERGGEGQIDDRLRSLMGGVRFKLGRHSPKP